MEPFKDFRLGHDIQFAFWKNSSVFYMKAIMEVKGEMSKMSN